MARCCDLGNRIEAITMSPELDKKSYGCKKDLLLEKGGGRKAMEHFGLHTRSTSIFQ